VLALIRIAIWLFAVLFAAGPVIVSVAPTPAHIRDLISLSSYLGAARDLLFLSVAILALGLVDSLENIAAVREAGKDNTFQFFASISMMLVIVPQLVLYSIWSAPNAALTSVDAQQIPVYVGGSLVCALIARLALVVGTS